MKQKMAHFIALTSILALSSQIFGYAHTFVNGTPHEASLQVNYNICKDERFVLSPGQSKEINAGACMLKSITVQLNDAESRAYFPVVPYVRGNFAGYAGTATWAIIGPIYPIKDNYRIWRIGLGLEEKQ